MAFGTVLKSFAMPGNTGSAPVLSWDGCYLWCSDLKNSRQIGLTQNGAIAATENVLGLFYSRARGNIYSTTGFNQGVAEYTSTPPYPLRTLFLAASGSVYNCLRWGAFIHTTTRSGGFAKWTAAGSQWVIVSSGNPPNVAMPCPGAFATDGIVLFTATSWATPILTKWHIPSYAIVSTASAPAASAVEGMAYDGRQLWVGIGGAIDRIYAVSVD